MNTKKEKFDLTREMKIYLLISIQKGFIVFDEFEDVFGLDIFIDDPFVQMRNNHWLTDCDFENNKNLQKYGT